MAVLHLHDAQEIHYELIEGRDTFPHLVFLHEGLGCIDMWKGFPQRVCKATGCPGLVYDRLGYGKSSALVKTRSIHYLHEYALTELPALLAHVIPGKEYFLVGHSDGGSISLIHASEKPALLKGIITEAAHVFVESVTLDGIRAAQEVFKAGKLGGLARYHGGKTDGIFNAWAQTWLGDGFASWNIEYLLPSISCPALVIQGVDDQYGTLAQVETIVEGARDAESAQIEQCGHAPHLEQADAVLRLMADFITHTQTDMPRTASA